MEVRLARKRPYSEHGPAEDFLPTSMVAEVWFYVPRIKTFFSAEDLEYAYSALERAKDKYLPQGSRIGDLRLLYLQKDTVRNHQIAPRSRPHVPET